MTDLEQAKEQLAASLAIVKERKSVIDSSGAEWLIKTEPALDWHRNNVKVQRKKIRELKNENNKTN